MNKKIFIPIYSFVVLTLVIIWYLSYATNANAEYIYPTCQICKESIEGEYMVLSFPSEYKGWYSSPPLLYTHLTCALISLADISLRSKKDKETPFDAHFRSSPFRYTGPLKETCAVSGCDSVAVYKGFCKKHGLPEEPELPSTDCPVCGETTFLCPVHCGNSPCVHGASGEKHKLGCLLLLSPKELEALKKSYEETK